MFWFFQLLAKKKNQQIQARIGVPSTFDKENKHQHLQSKT
jgi:hypothetical protein